MLPRVKLGNAMRLYIGKSHRDNKDTATVQSIFRLAGNDEDALTYSLGFLLAHDPVFCKKIVRIAGVRVPRSFESDYSIHLQEVTGRGYGRRDIAIVSGKMRLVLEAKIGRAEPTVDQLTNYAGEDELWSQYERRVIVALTQVELNPATEEIVRSKLSCYGISFASVQWHEIVELVLAYRPLGDSGVSRYLFDEFSRYIRKDYRMGYHDAEVYIQNVNLLNAKIYKKGWMYLGSQKKAPLYFAPYFTGQGANSGISLISRVSDIVVVRAGETEVVVDVPSDEHLEKWRQGLVMLRERAETEGFLGSPIRVLHLDRPITFMTPPLTKKAFKAIGPSKLIPPAIPKGFSLRFDELLWTQAVPPAS